MSSSWNTSGQVTSPTLATDWSQVPSASTSAWYRALAVVQGVMVDCGLAGNTLNLLAATLDQQLRAATANVFVINLGLADLVVTTVTMPFALLGTVYGPGLLAESPLICEVVSTVCTTACVASLATIVVISVNRYVALLHPHAYGTVFTWRNSALICLVPWSIGVGWTLPLHYGWSRNTFDRRFTMCWFDRNPRFYSYRFVRVLGMELLPLLLVLVLYVRMFLYLRRKRHQTADTGQVQVKGQQREIRLAKTLFVLYLGFLAGWSGLAAVLLLDVENTWPPAIHVIAVTVAHSGSSGLNFLLYSFTNKNFRRAYRNMSRRIWNATCCGRSCCPWVEDARNSTDGGATKTRDRVSHNGNTIQPGNADPSKWRP